MTIAMRMLALLLVCALAVPAHAQLDDAPTSTPSVTLERAIKLYDRTDYISASVELQKILAGQTADTARGKERAEFFMGKTLYQMGFYAAAWSRFASIIQTGATHTYFAASSKWLIAILRVTPSPSVRSVMFAYRGTSVIDDPVLSTIRDEFAYQLGRELAGRDVPKSEAIDMLSKVSPSSPFGARAQLELARVKLRAKDIPGGIEAAMLAGQSPDLGIEAAHAIATWTHIHGAADQARAPLGVLAKTSAYARYQLSRAMLDGKLELPGLDRVTSQAFDAVMLPSACRARWPADVKPLARTVLAEARPVIAKLLGFEDNNELFEHVRRMAAQRPMPGTDVALAVLSDPTMRERLAWVDEINKELGMMQKLDRAWQTTQAAAEVLQELTVIQSIEMADTGLAARQRLQLLARELDVLEKVIAGASPAFALSAGPDVELGSGLAVTSELCGAGGGTAPTIAAPIKPTSGCAGCQTRESSWSFLVIAALVLAKMKRRARPRSTARRQG